MTPEQFIGEAIDRGVRDGLSSLSQVQAYVFLISEAEAHCDMDGIDIFLDRYNSMEVLMAAEAFRSVGAKEIAKWLERIAALLPERTEAELSRANDLITSRAGYNYEAIEHMVASHIGI